MINFSIVKIDVREVFKNHGLKKLYYQLESKFPGTD